jgi:hypothetical protein
MEACIHFISKRHSRQEFTMTLNGILFVYVKTKGYTKGDLGRWAGLIL